MRLLVVTASPPNSSFSAPSDTQQGTPAPGPRVALAGAIGVDLDLVHGVVLLWFRHAAGCGPPDGGWPPARSRRAAPPGLPGPAQQPHAAHPLDRHEEIDSPENRPPAGTGRVHPRESLQPALAHHRGPVTAKAAGLDLEAQQAQPVPHAPVPDELALAGQVQLPDAKPPVHMGAALAQPPQAGRVHAADARPGLPARARARPRARWHAGRRRAPACGAIRPGPGCWPETAGRRSRSAGRSKACSPSLR
jgi:hypothetical protein